MEPPLKVKFETTGWKNIFVSVEEAMVPEKNKHIPLVMDVTIMKKKQCIIDGDIVDGATNMTKKSKPMASGTKIHQIMFSI